MRVRGSGSPEPTLPQAISIDSVVDDGPVTVVRAGDLNLTLARVVGARVEGDYTLTGQVGDSAETYVLAGLRRS
jgi:hypothetical protein